VTNFISDDDETGELDLDGSTSGRIRIIPPSVVMDYLIVLPALQGLLGQSLINDGSGNLSWVTISSVNDITMSKLVPLSNELIPPGYGAFLPDRYEVVLGFITEIGLNSVLEIG
jgi:hypothetical protein